MSKINQYLSPAHIQVYDQLSSWEEATEIAATPLLTDGSITTQYIDNMIASVHQHGPYMILTDFFALMHARPDETVIKEDMSLLVVKKPVDLLGNPINIFLVLAAKDNKSHVSYLQQIVTIFMDDEKFELIKSGDYKKIIEIFN